jgi:hypothetical protein
MGQKVIQNSPVYEGISKECGLWKNILMTVENPPYQMGLAEMAVSLSMSLAIFRFVYKSLGLNPGSSKNFF